MQRSLYLGVETVKPLNEMVYPQPTQAQALLNELGFAIEDEGDRRGLRKWIVVIILALLCHLLASLYHLNWEAVVQPPMPVDIKTVDPAKLDAIRKQWHDKSILIDKGAKAAAEAPKDARYFSDKNIRVEKEQRARETNVLPRPGAPGPMGESKPEQKSETKPLPQTLPHTLPNLGNLGVPMHLDRKPPPQEEQPQQGQTQFHGNDGGDQAVLDRNLPQGSENMLNAEESVFYSFYARMYEAIAPVWQSRIREVAGSQRVAAGEYTTQVDVVLDKSGNLIGVRRMHSSGVDAFDKAVDAALAKTGHFPNPPKDLLNESGEVHTGWTFTVSLQQGTGYNFAPPERVY